VNGTGNSDGAAGQASVTADIAADVNRAAGGKQLSSTEPLITTVWPAAVKSPE